MTVDEAIICLSDLKIKVAIPKAAVQARLNNDALNMAIEALRCSEFPNNWIPCSERLPEEEYVLISKKPSKISGDKWCVTIAIRTADQRSRKVQWRDSGFGIIPDDKVLAWLPLPEPYQEGGTE